MQRCSSLLIIREMKIKTTVRYHLKPIGMAIFKSLQINAGAGMEKKGNLPTLLVGMEIGISDMEDSMGVP